MNKPVNAYDFAVGVILRGSFSHPDTGAPLDPGQVLLKLKNPLGVTTIYTYQIEPDLLRESAGKYRMEIHPAIPGHWTYQFRGLDSNEGSGTKEFYVREDPFD